MAKHDKEKQAENVIETIVLWPLQAFRLTQVALAGKVGLLQAGGSDAAALGTLMYMLGEAGTQADGAMWLRAYVLAGMAYAAAVELLFRMK